MKIHSGPSMSLRLVELVVLVLLAFGSPTIGQNLPASPCPAIYSYETDHTGQPVGLIRLQTPPRYAEVRLVARLSSAVPVQRHEVGELQLKGGREAAMEATRGVLASRRHTLEYHLRFPPGKPTPTLLALLVNEVEICTRPQGAPPNSRSTITLQSFLNTGVSGAPQAAGHEFGSSSGGGGGSLYVPEEPEQPPPSHRPAPVQPQRPFPPRPAPTRPPPDPDISLVKWDSRLLDVLYEEYRVTTHIRKTLSTLLDLEDQRLVLQKEIMYLQKLNTVPF